MKTYLSAPLTNVCFSFQDLMLCFEWWKKTFLTLFFWRLQHNLGCLRTLWTEVSLCCCLLLINSNSATAFLPLIYRWSSVWNCTVFSLYFLHLVWQNWDYSVFFFLSPPISPPSLLRLSSAVAPIPSLISLPRHTVKDWFWICWRCFPVKGSFFSLSLITKELSVWCNYFLYNKSNSALLCVVNAYWI